MAMKKNGTRGPRSPAGGVFRVVEEALAGGEFASLDEARRAVDDAVGRHNSTPRAELLGLSPDQVHRLLEAEWGEPGSAVRLDPTVELEALEHARTLVSARRFLRALQDDGGTRATRAGNLNRAFVAEMVEELSWRPGFREELRRWNKVVDEGDARPLHILRVLLEEAGLAALRKGTFRATGKARDLLAEERAGALFALLFRTHFRVLNLAYLDRAAPAPGFQDCAAVALYRFGALDPAWRTPAELVGQLLLPAVRDQIPIRAGWDPAALILQTRLLDPLEGFGLAELRESPGPTPHLPTRRFRRTPLFGRFLGFRV